MPLPKKKFTWLFPRRQCYYSATWWVLWEIITCPDEENLHWAFENSLKVPKYEIFLILLLSDTLTHMFFVQSFFPLISIVALTIGTTCQLPCIHLYFNWAKENIIKHVQRPSFLFFLFNSFFFSVLHSVLCVSMQDSACTRETFQEVRLIPCSIRQSRRSRRWGPQFHHMHLTNLYPSPL